MRLVPACWGRAAALTWYMPRDANREYEQTKGGASALQQGAWRLRSRQAGQECRHARGRARQREIAAVTHCLDGCMVSSRCLPPHTRQAGHLISALCAWVLHALVSSLQSLAHMHRSLRCACCQRLPHRP